MKTTAIWIDEKRLYVEPPTGDDFIVGFLSDTQFRIERQSVFKTSHDLALLFDNFYKGNASVIMGEISKQMLIHGYGMIDFCQTVEKTEKDDERVRIGKRIKELRLEKGLDAKTLATIAGIDAANLCRIEAGKYSVGFDILSKIAKVFNKKIDFIDLSEDGHECITNIRTRQE